MRPDPTWLCACLLLAAGCAGPRVQTVGETIRTSGGPAAEYDGLDFTGKLAAHQALPADERTARRVRAEAEAADWRLFEQQVKAHYDRLYRSWWYRQIPDQSGNRRGVGLGNALVDLQRATLADPSFVEAWAALGHLHLQTGNLPAALAALQTASQAAAAQDEAGAPLAAADEARIHTELAWAWFDAARWEEGLAAAARGLALAPAEPELLLVHGLLLASAGRGPEALAAAATMPPMRYPMLTFTYEGLRYQESSYANNWIRALVYLQQGDARTALHALGELDLYEVRIRLPCAERFWRDVGLIGELAGDKRAPIWYSIGHLSRAYGGFFPVSAKNVASQIGELPDPRMPVFTSYGARDYAGGSPLVYVGLQLNLMTTSLLAERRLEAASRAITMLGIIERRGLAPLFCHAERGRILYAMEDFRAAEVDLARAHELLAAEGRVDPVTSMLLGLLALQDGRDADAAVLLTEVVNAEPRQASAWRMLGVARARCGDTAAAARAMDRAVDLDPQSVAGWYNRGLQRLQLRSYSAAAADLARAYRLEPDNREVQRLLQMAVSGARANGEPLPDAVAVSPAAASATDSMPDLMPRQLDALFALPDSLRVDPAEATARILLLEKAYAEAGDPLRRRDLALAYLDDGRYRDVQRLLGAGWGIDLAPDEEIMLLHVDHKLGEQGRAADLTRALLAGEAGKGNPYLWWLTALTIRDADPRGGMSKTNEALLKYCAGMKSESYGFPPLDRMTDWMRDGFAESRAARADPDPGVVLPLPNPWFRNARGLPEGLPTVPPVKGATK